MRTSFTILVILGLLGSGPTAVGANQMPAQITGTDIVTSRPVELSFKDSLKGTVIVFLSARCPCSASHEQKIAQYASDFSRHGFRFLGIHSNADEESELAKKHFSAANFPFPVIEDKGARIANAFGAIKTPHAYLVTPQGQIIFRGGVDDSHIAQTSKKQYLRDAIIDVSNGRAPEKSDARTLGCVIKRP